MGLEMSHSAAASGQRLKAEFVFLLFYHGLAKLNRVSTISQSFNLICTQRHLPLLELK